MSYARIGSAILDTEGVEDYENLTVNGGTGNLSIPAKYAAVLGEVTAGRTGEQEQALESFDKSVDARQTAKMRAYRDNVQALYGVDPYKK